MGDFGSEQTLAELRRAQQFHDRVSKGMRFATPVLVIGLALSSLRTDPQPTMSGHGLVVGCGWIAFVIGTALGAIWRRRGWVQSALLSVGFAGGVTLVLVQPHGIGLLGVFVTAGVALWRRLDRVTLIALTLVVGATVVSWLVRGQAHADGRVVAIVALACMTALVMLARQFRVATERAEKFVLLAERTRVAEIRLAALTEKETVARDMHDVLAHSLSGLMLQLEAARLLATNDPADPRLPEAIDTARQLAVMGFDEAKGAIGTLRSEGTQQPEQAIETLTARFQRTSGIPSIVTILGRRRPVSAQANLAMYRVVQEALTNAARHANPDRIDVTINFGPESLLLRVEDYNERPADSEQPGFLASEPPIPGNDALALRGVSGYGLQGMRERAALLGGALSTSRTGHGFVVEMSVPL